jgi:hypothetical protein
MSTFKKVAGTSVDTIPPLLKGIEAALKDVWGMGEELDEDEAGKMSAIKEVVGGPWKNGKYQGGPESLQHKVFKLLAPSSTKLNGQACLATMYVVALWADGIKKAL